MASIWWTFNATRRQRWGSWLALSLLVALAGGIVLAGAAAALRTSSAFPAFDARYGGDVALFSAGPQAPAIATLHGVQRVFEASSFANGNVEAATTFIPSQDVSLLVFARGQGVHAFRLISGRLPQAADEIDVGFSLQQQANLHLGSIVKVPLYAAWQAAAFFNSSGYLPPKGGMVSLRVVGFSASILDFPTNTASYSMVASQAFSRAHASRAVVGAVGIYRLKGGAAALPRFTFTINHLPNNHIVYPYPLASLTSAIDTTIRPQVVGWWLFALIAAVAGLALVGQALARQSIVERASYPTMSAVGLTPAQLFGLGMARALAVGVVGTAGALGLAVALSPLTPVGEARAAEPVTGFVLDTPVLVIGTLGLLLTVLVLALYPAWRASQARQVLAADTDTYARRASVLAGAAAQVGASPSMVIGIRHALERGRGRGSVPVTTALLGTVAAVAALVGTSVFGSSLSNLLGTPSLYGQTWQLDLGNNLNATQSHAIAKRLGVQPRRDRRGLRAGGEAHHRQRRLDQRRHLRDGEGAAAIRPRPRSRANGRRPDRARDPDARGRPRRRRVHSHGRGDRPGRPHSHGRGPGGG